MMLNFRLVPQHSRILAVVAFSFFHKTWLSWLANREERAVLVGVSLDLDAKPLALGELAAAGSFGLSPS